MRKKVHDARARLAIPRLPERERGLRRDFEPSIIWYRVFAVVARAGVSAVAVYVLCESLYRRRTQPRLIHIRLLFDSLTLSRTPIPIFQI